MANINITTYKRSNKLKQIINRIWQSGYTYSTHFLKWLILSVFIGIICGTAGSVFFKSIEYVTTLRLSYKYITLLLPFAGLIIVFIYKKLGVSKDKGTNLVLDSIHSHEQIPDVMAPLIYLGTVITHFFGGSSGREGAALQMGGCIGVFIGKKIKLDEKDINVLTMCGMSAVFTAMFGTPITATIFSMEVISVGMFHYSAFVPCIIASAFSLGTAKKFGIEGENFLIMKLPELTPVTYGKVIILAIICGLIAIIFCLCAHKTHSLFAKLIKNKYLRIMSGGAIVSLFLLITDSQYYSGAGFNIIDDAFNGSTGVETFIIKIILTAITLGCGFKGGEIVPALAVGASFGSFLGPILGMPSDFSAGIGLICLFCGVVNCPIAAIILAMEMFGQHHLLLFAIASGISYVFSGCFGLYNSQKILYSKLHAEFINTHSH